MANAKQMARVFKALSTPARVRIITLLKDRNLCVNALAARLDVSAAAVSQHLRILRDADVVVSDKRGNHVHYRINPGTLRRWGILAAGLLSTDDE